MPTKPPKHPDDLPREVANDLLTEVVLYLKGADRPSDYAINYAVKVLNGVIAGKPVRNKRGRPASPEMDEAMAAIMEAAATGKRKNFHDACDYAAEKTGIGINSIKAEWSRRYPSSAVNRACRKGKEIAWEIRPVFGGGISEMIRAMDGSEAPKKTQKTRPVKGVSRFAVTRSRSGQIIGLKKIR